ncbi:protein AGENET DOMAIN (AGD)-CONTAINING P1 [Syzygium oleosum]|uniref:protein AGENET DOMAIN (AGD)-CONTAINING P1 n=1 Tax=Syzygium oleosum TaxID=219896 RepID=UPI0011D26F8B|nr:protein AGENET DOMAIN (AGD)-CONTAINING P1 [Syzygium oleosum]
MRFLPGQEVEIASKEEGFIGSYYKATIVTYIQNEFYLVQYRELLKEDESGPLREVIRGEDIRPTPPAKLLPTASAGFAMLDRVDALYNDGWWTGRITGREGSTYVVHFENSGERLAFSDSDLRMHLEWVNGNWIATTRRRILLPQKQNIDS